MAKKTFVAALMAVAVATPAHADWRDRLNPSLYSMKQPVVERNDLVIDLAGGNGVSPRELERLAAWFDTLQLGYADRISVDTGGYDDPRSRQDIASVAADYGLLLTRVGPITTSAIQPGTVRVVVTRSVAYVPGCPDWSDAPEIGSRVTTPPGYGCAVNKNLAAMIADPNDLVLGQTGTVGGDAVTMNKTVDAYRKRAPSGASGQVNAESSKGGK